MFCIAAPIYDLQPLQRWLYRPPQDEIVALLKAADARRVGDIGCGTGILADRIERELHPDEVYGVDVSDGMLSQAKRRSRHVEWLAGAAEQLPFEDSTLDAVVTTTAFHFFDQPAALREFCRVLAPGGVAAVAAFTSPMQPPLLPGIAADPFPVAHNRSPAQMRSLFEESGLRVSDQHRIRRPLWPEFLSDLITIGAKP